MDINLDPYDQRRHKNRNFRKGTLCVLTDSTGLLVKGVVLKRLGSGDFNILTREGIIVCNKVYMYTISPRCLFRTKIEEGGWAWSYAYILDGEDEPTYYNFKTRKIAFESLVSTWLDDSGEMAVPL